MRNLKYFLIAIIINSLPLISLAEGLTEKNIVYLYQDDGVSEESLSQTMFTLKKNLPHQYRVKKINAAAVIQNNWVKNAAIFIMPGGADLPFAKKLNGKGNDNIKKYVTNGGSYLGICAGAYYGSAYVQFDKGGKLEVLGNRELAFFKGSAIGPVLAKYDYKNNSGSRAARIKLKSDPSKEAIVYYNGGSYFESAAHDKNVSVIGYYRNQLPAIVSISYGKGHVVLSGVHFEYNPDLMNTHDAYLTKIVADLKLSDEVRTVLTKDIFNKLGISL